MNDLAFGGYLMWRLPTQVYIDSRLEVIGESFYEQYKASFESNRALEATASQWGIGWIVVPILQYPFVIQRMARNRDWILAHVDQISVIWVSRRGRRSMRRSACSSVGISGIRKARA